MSAADFPRMGMSVSARSPKRRFDPTTDEKLCPTDLLRVVAEVGSALAACGLLNWVAG